MTTVNTNSNTGLVLGGTITNPVTVASGVTLAGSSFGIQGTGTAWNVTNLGSVHATGTASSGITLANGGTVTNVATAAVSGGLYGVAISGAAGTLTNSGNIVSGGSGEAGFFHMAAVSLSSGLVDNTATGTISGSGSAGGVVISGTGTLVNDGSITGHDGIVLAGAGSSVTNTASGHVSGATGIRLSGGATLVNAGHVTATFGFAVGGASPVNVVNQAGGVINSVFGGVYGYGGSTVTNSGTIVGGNNRAVYFAGGGSNLVIVNAGAVFTGTVAGSGNATNRLELAAAGGAGTLTGLGTSFTNFGTVTVDAGAQWTLSGANTVAASAVLTDAGTLTNSSTLGAAVTLTAGAVLTNTSSGSISSTAGSVLATQAGGTVYNAGTISASGSTAAAVLLQQGGVVTNASTGRITAANGISMFAASGTVVNQGSIIADTTHAAIYLGHGGTVTNATSGVLVGGTGINVSGAAGSVDNQGHITISGHGSAVYLDQGGSVTNEAGATIVGFVGVEVYHAAGTVTNQGSIDGNNYSGIYLAQGGTVTNAGAGSISGKYGVYIAGGSGTVTNAAVITATGTGARSGVAISTAGASVSNTGLITGVTGVRLIAGGTLSGGGTIVGTGGTAASFGGTGTSRLVLSPSAVFTGLVMGSASGSNALELASAATAGTISGLGTSFTNFAAITVDSGATWTLAGSDTLDAGATLTNNNTLLLAGTLANSGTITGAGITLVAGGVLTNTSSGRISGGNAGVFSTQAGGSLYNAGSISAGNTAAAVLLQDGGSVTNAASGLVAAAYGISVLGAAGTILNQGSIATSASLAIGVSLAEGGSVTNSAQGTITSRYGVYISGTTGTVVNAGVILTDVTGVEIAASGGVDNSGLIQGILGVFFDSAGSVTNSGTILGGGAVQLSDGGSVVNTTGGVISGSSTGVVIQGALGTVVNQGSIGGGVSLSGGGMLSNAGTIAGSNGTAAYLGGTGSNLVVIDPGAVFTGLVAGSTNAINTLELASAANAGTISGLGASFINFGAITVDAGAQWTLSGVNTLAAAATLTAQGTLALAGTLTNRGAIVADNVNLDAGITLAGGLLTNQSGASISGSLFGVEGTGTVVNSGDIYGSVDGIYFNDGGTVTNTATGTIDGSHCGIQAGNAAATVVNAGTISDSTVGGVVLYAGGQVSNAASAMISGVLGVRIVGGGTITNSGAIAGLSQSGVVLVGSVTNAAGGVITGASYGVYGHDGSTVVNAGTISGANGTAVDFAGTGSNLVVIDPGAVFTGLVAGSASATNKLELASAASVGTLSTSFTNFNEGTLDAGAQWTLTGANAISNYLTDSGTLTNTGSLAAIVTLTGGALLTNAGGGVIAGAVAAVGGTLVNAASAAINGGRYGVRDSGTGASVLNSGSITAGTGVYLYNGAQFTNAAGALISAASNGITAYGAAAGTLVNQGSIGGDSSGVYFQGAGTLTNAASGVVSGATDAVVGMVADVDVVNDGLLTGSIGVSLAAGGTLTNAGTIAGTSGTAGYFGGTGASLLVIDPGAVFTGIVAGSASGSNVMELASAASAGTIGGLGSSFTNFTAITIDAGAAWQLGGANTLAAGSTLTNAGTLTLDTASLADAGDAVNDGAITLDPSTLDLQNLLGTGSVAIAAGSTLAVSGTLSAGQTLTFQGGDAMLRLGDAPAVTATIAGFAAGDTIDVTDLAFVSAHTAASVAGNVLTVTDTTATFTLATSGLADGTALVVLADGTGGTDIVISTGAVPAGLTLSPASDSGTPGDHSTDIATPVITGTGITGDTITLYDGTSEVGTALVTGGVWSITSGPLPLGSATLTATQTDTLGAVSAASSPLALTIVAAPSAPTGLSLDVASDSGVVGDDLTNHVAPSIDGSGEAGAIVRLYYAGSVVGSGTVDGGGLWSIATSTLPAGTDPITATQTDAAGNVSAASIALPLVIETALPAAPTLSLDAASDSGVAGDDLTNDTTPSIDGTGLAGAVITLFDAGTQIGTATVTGAGTWSVAIPTLEQGAHPLTATQTDAAGNTSGASAILPLVIDTTPPAAPTGLVLAPASDSGIAGDDVTDHTQPVITGSSGGPDGDTVRLYDGTTLLGTATVAGGAWAVGVGTALANGVHALTAVEVDPAGNFSAASAPLGLTIDVPPAPGTPVLDLASDSGVAGDDITRITTPTLDGTGVTGDVVTLYDGAGSVGSAVVAGGAWSVALGTALADGVHDFTATQTDSYGDVSAASAALPVTIVTHAAAPTIAETASQTTPAQPVVEGAAPGGATITLYDGTIAVGTATASGTASGTGGYTFSFAAPLAVGTHRLTAVATDVAGNVSAASAALVVQVDASGSYSIVSTPASNGGYTTRTYDAGGTFTQVDSFNAAAQLLQSLSDTRAILEIYDDAGRLIGTIQQPDSSPAIQPPFATTGLPQAANTGTSTDGSQITLLGESNEIHSSGNDVVTAGPGADTIIATGPSISITGGSGTLLFVGTTGASTVSGGTGSSSLFGGSGGGLLVGGSGGHNALVAGGGNTTLVGGGSGDTLVGAAGNATLVMQTGAVAFGGSAAASIFSAGSGVMVGGSGSSSMVGGAAGHDAMWGGSGSTAEFGAGAGDTLVGGAAGQSTLVGGGSGDTLFVGGAGAASAYGGGGNDVFFANGGGAMSIVEGAGQDEVLFAGGGANSVAGGGGTDLYDVVAEAGQAGGADVISGFKVGTDQLRLFGYDAAAVQQNATTGSTVLSLADGTQITLLGITHLGSSLVVA